MSINDDSMNVLIQNNNDQVKPKKNTTDRSCSILQPSLMELRSAPLATFHANILNPLVLTPTVVPRCSRCHSGFANEKNLANHMRKCMACPSCSKCFMNTAELNFHQHINHRHDDNDGKCDEPQRKRTYVRHRISVKESAPTSAPLQLSDEMVAVALEPNIEEHQ